MCEIRENAMQKRQFQQNMKDKVRVFEDGGSEEKPVGTVWFAFASASGEGITRRECFSGDRDAVRRQATVYALQTLWQQFLQNT